jgi:DNA-binding beta-propeller fold protein YncE
MRIFFLAASVSLVTVANAVVVSAADIRLEPVRGFVQLPDDLTLGPVSAVSVNGKGEILLFHRGKRPIVVLDADGKYLRAWGDDIIANPNGAHGLRIDSDENVWVTDIVAHRVYKFAPEGKLLLALGTGKPGADDDQFNKPTDIAFEKDAVYVSDGYGNSRVVKFTRDGRFVKAWGTPGKGEGEFHLPHSIVFESPGRVFVGDRENDRIQIFDTDGKLLTIWKGYAPYGLALDRGGALFVADARASKVHRLGLRGEIVQSWGGKGTGPGEFDTPHMLAFDAAGNLYVAEIGNKRLQKFRRDAK